MVIRTRIATIRLTENGVIHVTIDAGAQQLLDDARAIVGAATSIANGVKRPILVDTRGSVALDTETRHFYTGRNLFDHFTALGLVVEATPMGMLRANIYFRVSRPTIPVRMFNETEPALEWLGKFADG